MRFAVEPAGTAAASPGAETAGTAAPDKCASETISKQNYEHNRGAVRAAAESFQPLPKPSCGAGGKEYGALDVLALSCTSMSVSLGDREVRALLESGYPDPSTQFATMSSAIIRALMAVHRRGAAQKEQGTSLRLALVTPYSDTLHGEMVTYFVEECRPWLDVVAQANFDLDRDTLVSSVQPESVIQCAHECIRSCGQQVDCALLCCSALRVTGEGFIDRAERALGVPVLTSNQCLIWESLHVAAGSQGTAVQRSEVEAVRGYGQLFALERPDGGPGEEGARRGA